MSLQQFCKFFWCWAVRKEHARLSLSACSCCGAGARPRAKRCALFAELVSAQLQADADDDW